MGFKFEKLDVWKRSIDFADETFQIADDLPQKYQYSLAGCRKKKNGTLIALISLIKASKST